MAPLRGTEFARLAKKITVTTIRRSAENEAMNAKLGCSEKLRGDLTVETWAFIPFHGTKDACSGHDHQADTTAIQGVQRQGLSRNEEADSPGILGTVHLTRVNG